MHSTSAATPLLLDYAPAPAKAWHWVRRAFRFVLFGGLIVATYIWGPVFWHHAQMLYWQRQCLDFDGLAGQMVYDNGLSGGQVIPPPACWAEFVDSAAQVGPALSGLPQFGSLVFVGQLKTPSGDPRLVAIAFTHQLNWWAPGQLGPDLSYQTWVLKPGSLLSPPQSISQSDAADKDVLLSVTVPPAPQFYFGQVNPADPSHATIRLQAWGQEDTVDVRIDDAGQLTLTQRNPRSPKS